MKKRDPYTWDEVDSIMSTIIFLSTVAAITVWIFSR
jgi:hypothetical protein